MPVQRENRVSVTPRAGASTGLPRRPAVRGRREPVANSGDLKAFDESMVGSARKTLDSGLVVNTGNSRDDRRSQTQIANCTYCVSDKFGNHKAAVVTATGQDAALWEGASSAVNDVCRSSADSNCTTRNNAVLFSIEPTKTAQYIARASVPSTPDRSRNVLVNATSLQSSGNWEPGDIMGHELGHILGFRHEHSRPEAGTCFEDNNWRPLTTNDSVSIMHHPQCNGGSADLEFSAKDAAGVKALYGG
jgi:hypothetical protein